MIDYISSIYGLSLDAQMRLGVLFICLYIVYDEFVVSRNNGIPPGPKFRLPILGQLFAVEPDMRNFLRKYRKQYGDIYSLYFGNKLVIFIAGYDKLKEAFVKNGTVFSYRPKDDTIIDKITKGLGVANTDGELWKEHRKFSLTTLRHFGMGKSILEDRIHAEVKVLLKAFKASESKPYNPENIISISVSNIISSIAFGANFNHSDKRACEMLEKIKENFANAGNSSLGTFIPSLALLPGDLFKIKAVLYNAEVVKGFLHEFILEHMQRYDENDITDFTSAFIKEMKLQQKSKETTTFTVEQLAMVLADFFVAGTETTLSALRWALVYLVNYPDIQEQLFQNIRDNVGTDNLPSVQDKTKLPLVEAFIMECLRHANIFFTSLPHATSQDVRLGGYRIPSDAIILADLDSVNSDRKKWKDPEVFRPQRFTDKDGSLLSVEEFTPFFLGKRSCIGESLAKMEMFLFLSAIVQNYKITAPSGEDLSLDTVDGVFGLTHVPKPFNILATPRTKH